MECEIYPRGSKELRKRTKQLRDAGIQYTLAKHWNKHPKTKGANVVGTSVRYKGD